MNYLNEEWEQIISKKRKHKGCIFIRVKNSPDCFVLKVYSHEHAQETADNICHCHNSSIRFERRREQLNSIGELLTEPHACDTCAQTCKESLVTGLVAYCPNYRNQKSWLKRLKRKFSKAERGLR